MKIPCFVISYNRPTFLKKCVEALCKEERLQIIIVDNNSDDSDVVKYLNELCDDYLNNYTFGGGGIMALRTKHNEGHTVVWKCIHGECKYVNDAELFETLIQGSPYLVTDCDIVVPDKLPWLDVLLQGMERLPKYNKFGLGLNTTQIPKHYPQREQVLHHENRVLYKKNIGDSRFIEAPVDTTLALYRAGYTNYSIWGNHSPLQYVGECKSVRTLAPYECTHLTWHMTKEELAGDEHQNYLKSINKNSTHWSAK